MTSQTLVNLLVPHSAGWTSTVGILYESDCEGGAQVVLDLIHAHPLALRTGPRVAVRLSLDATGTSWWRRCGGESESTGICSTILQQRHSR